MDLTIGFACGYFYWESKNECSGCEVSEVGTNDVVSDDDDAKLQWLTYSGVFPKILLGRTTSDIRQLNSVCL